MRFQAYAWSFFSLVLCFECAHADLPNQGVVTAGSINIETPDTNHMQITQSTDKAIINWNSFNVGENQSVQFIVPNANAATLNRVTGGNPSEILGSVKSNGQLWLLNPNGIMFGKNAQINVAGLMASTLNITDKDFTNGDYHFQQEGSNLAQIVNEGRITAADQGYVAFLAPQIANSGIIAARLGTVALGAGTNSTLTFAGNRLLSIAVNQGAQVPMYDSKGEPVAALVHSGEIYAEGGHVLLTSQSVNSLLDQCVNLSGIVKANAVCERQGKIVLTAVGNALINNANLNVAGDDAGETGGKVELIGKNVRVFGDTTINASGAAGGGEIRIGRDDTDPDAFEAASTIVARGVVLDASATQSGNGGFVETSGNYLDVAGVHVNTSAVNGEAGTWLLDPYNITISSGSTSGGSFNDGTFTPTSNSTIVNTADILSNLATTNVNITTGSGGSQNGDIVVSSSIAYTGSSHRTLTITAAGALTLSSGVSINDTGAAGNLSLNFVTTGGAAASGVSMLGTVNIKGDFGLTASGNVTNGNINQLGGALIVAGTSTFTINTNANNTVSFQRAGNDSGTVMASGTRLNSFTYKDSNALTVGNISGTSGLTASITAAGNLTQATGTTIATGSGGVTLKSTAGNVAQSGTAGITGTGAVTANASTGVINLSGTGNTFTGALTATNTTNSNPIALTFYTANASSFPSGLTVGANKLANLTVTAPHYNDTGSSGSLETFINNGLSSVATPSSFDLSVAAASDTAGITLYNGTTSATPAINLGAVSSGNFHNISLQSAGDINLNMLGGGGTLTAINAHSIDLQTTGHSKTITVTPNATKQLTTTSAMTLKATGTGDAIAFGTGAFAVANGVVTPTLNLEANAGTLTLDSLSSGSGGAFALDVTENGTISASSLALGSASTLGQFGTFTLTANGLTTDNAGHTLDSLLGNALSNVSSNATATLNLGSFTPSINLANTTYYPNTLTLQNLYITSGGALNLGTTTASGTLSMITAGAMTQSGALSVTGATTLAAGSGNDITLNNGGNDFGAVSLTSAKNINLMDANNLSLTSLSASGDVTVLAQSGTLSFGSSSAPLINLTGGSNTTQTVTLAAQQFSNGYTGSSNAIDMSGSGSSSRWLFYLSNLSGNTFGSGMASGNQALFGTVYGDTLPSSASTGSRYIFGTGETIALAPLATPFTVSKAYGDTATLPTPAASNEQVSGFVTASDYNNVFTQDTLDNVAVSGVGYVSKGASPAATAGDYDITMEGAGSTTTGYGVSYNRSSVFGTLAVAAAPTPAPTATPTPTPTSTPVSTPISTPISTPVSTPTTASASASTSNPSPTVTDANAMSGAVNPSVIAQNQSGTEGSSPNTNAPSANITMNGNFTCHFDASLRTEICQSTQARKQS